MHRPLIVITALLLAACAPEDRSAKNNAASAVNSVLTPSLTAASKFPPAAAMECGKCHPQQLADWLASQHARANRLADTNDAAAFAAQPLVHGSFTTHFGTTGGFHFAESFSNGPAKRFNVEAVIGIEPLRQYLVAAHGGRWQTQVVAHDPRSNDWFNAQGTEDRQPHEWGFWTNRSMTWNVQCAFCHMTDFKKNYDETTDSYASTWSAMGISCAQCHPTSHGSAAHQPPKSGDKSVASPACPISAAQKIPTNRAMENCASCHARREELTGTFAAGENFHDHYRLTLPDAPGIYYADGQVRDEDFEYGSFQLSKMGHKGVTCLDCHNPHSGKLKLPAEDNSLCMQCHTPPGIRGAKPVDIATHSHHAPGSAGSQCINCHMPVTHYMIRDPRRDHGFTIPDPQLTLDLQIPNACNRCHTDQDAAWANEATKTWYGEKMERPERRRARAIARAWEADPAIHGELLALLATEQNPAWQATLISLLAPHAARPEVAPVLVAAATNANPLVRSAALRASQGTPVATALLPTLRNDPARLVRLDAAIASAGTGEIPQHRVAEVEAYLRNISDQPAGALRRAEYCINLGRQQEAEMWARRAAQWDGSAEPQHILGIILNAAGKSDEALTVMQRAAQLGTNSASIHYDLALLYGERGRTAEAASALARAVIIEPRFGRAWYNLGLARAGLEKLDEALEALRQAERLLPGSPDPAYAAATIYLRQKKTSEARDAVRRALKNSPNHHPSLDLLRSLETDK